MIETIWFHSMHAMGVVVQGTYRTDDFRNGRSVYTTVKYIDLQGADDPNWLIEDKERSLVIDMVEGAFDDNIRELEREHADSA